MILDGSAPAVGTRSASTQEHRAQSVSGVECAVLTVSDTRTLEDDRGGALVVEILARMATACASAPSWPTTWRRFAAGRGKYLSVAWRTPLS
jgi:hypothetical protein